MEGEKFISFGLSKYVNFWKVNIAKSSTNEMKMKPYWNMFCCNCQNCYYFKVQFF
jgi:hypothetical protein